MPVELSVGDLELALEEGSSALKKIDPLLSAYVLDDLPEYFKNSLPMVVEARRDAGPYYASVGFENSDDVALLTLHGNFFRETEVKKILDLVPGYSNKFYLLGDGQIPTTIFTKVIRPALVPWIHAVMFAGVHSALAKNRGPLNLLKTEEVKRPTDILVGLMSSWLLTEIKISQSTKFVTPIDVTDREFRIPRLSEAEKNRLFHLVVGENPTYDGISLHKCDIYFNPVSLGLGIPISGEAIAQFYWDNKKVSFRSLTARFSGYASFSLQLPNGMAFVVKVPDAVYKVNVTPVL